MHDKELVGYIEKELQKGFHHNEIRRALLAVGHDAQIVEDSLLHVHNNLERKMKVKKALSILIPILLVLLIIVARLEQDIVIIVHEHRVRSRKIGVNGDI